MVSLSTPNSHKFEFFKELLKGYASVWFTLVASHQVVQRVFKFYRKEGEKVKCSHKYCEVRGWRDGSASS